MTTVDGSEQDALYSEWEPTEWTARQRAAAISSLALLACASTLLAFTLARWGTGPLAMDTFVPIGMTLLCLGALLLSYVFWYAYKHGHNDVGDHARTATANYVMLALVACVALVTLALQVVGGILVATGHWLGWRPYSAISYWAPGWISLLFGVMLSMAPSILKWRPMRNPTRPASAVGTPVAGARLLLRWAVMALARNPWLLIGVPMYALFTLWGEKYIPSVAPQMPIQEPIVLFGVAAAFFLVAALVEMTHRP